MDLDFSLVLVVATLLCGLGWGLDLLLTRRRRVRLAADVPSAGDNAPAAVLKAEPVLVEYAHSFFPVLAVVLVLRSFLLEPFTIPSGSMLPTLEVGDYILVNKYAYGLRLPVAGIEFMSVGKPKRGDVMVFRYPPKPTMNFIKRVIGLPGDHIRTTDSGDLYVNDRLMPRKLVSQVPDIDPWEQYFEEDLTGVKHTTRQEVGTESRRKIVDLVVPQGEYFMMGDNRDNSNDSRYWGTVPDRMIVGKAIYVWVHKEPGIHAPTFSRNGAVK
ncbi:signal peptidase I [Fluviicoccus keumensis]|uniref:signal peptidase I n=1 Tax=Fluviicoccus keumensis TaxID=1435465 RepID=UPI00102D120F|nr:signal peptidase I [Fluviicoccus keumensis]